VADLSFNMNNYIKKQYSAENIASLLTQKLYIL
jgi:hypothetical protein